MRYHLALSGGLELLKTLCKTISVRPVFCSTRQVNSTPVERLQSLKHRPIILAKKVTVQVAREPVPMALCGLTTKAPMRGGIVLAPNFEAAVTFVNDYAPEHLMIHSAHPFEHLGKIVNASEILLGENTPFTLANFVLGPNNVLPTSGAAKTWSPLSVLDFVKRSSVGHVSAAAYPELAAQAHIIATHEGFEGHALAISDYRKDVRG